ncbi:MULTISPECIES: NAD-dependent epimerase/dehydratase family protein [Actinoalloteichus]|uniref:NAD-dependent epimerase/dehydratase family protein n=1 Tax=Actinoalloteichus TaxID=65496 RepID=UPI0018DB9B4B|nr:MULTISPECIES: NAD-dependent epimerase/dehydratase family protein [Actinoalloteichus]
MADVFVTGVTGYIGGSIAVGLLAAGHQVTGLTRDPAKDEALRALGVVPVHGKLDDLDLLRAQAARADAVVNAASSDHRQAVDALVEGLAGSDRPLLHTSGTSVVSDQAGGEASDRVFTEATEYQPVPDKVARVELDRAVVSAAERGVRSVVLCNSLIYGTGRGLRPDSLQVPELIRQARESGIARHVGAGANVWSTVHIDDLVALYLAALGSAPAGSFFYVENGEVSFAALTAAIAESLGLGEPESWDEDSAAAEWGEEVARHALASNSRVRSDLARTVLGWRPRHSSVLDWIRTESTRPSAGQPAANR